MIIKDEIYVKISPQNIDMLTKIIEGYEHLGIVSTIDRKAGLVVIRGSKDTYPEIENILSFLPFSLEILKDQ